MSCPMESHNSVDYSSNIMMEALPTFMRAVQVHAFGGPDVLQIDVDVPMPSFNDSQILIKVFTIGVNPWETYARSGHFNIGKLPFIPGSDCAGVVVRVGSKVTKVKCGDRVYTVKSVTGTYAEFTVADEGHVFHLHENLTFSQGASLGVPYFTAYRALFYKAQCQRGEMVLVHGASGAVGLACCQIARAYGMNVVATAGSELGLNLLKKNGVQSVFNHNSIGYLKEIQEAVGDRGVDIICEMFACKNIQGDIPLLAKHGRLITIGSRGQATFSPADLFYGEKSIQGVAVFSSSEEEYALMASALEKGVVAGWLRPVISQEFPLSDAAAAHQQIIEHHGGSSGKLILSI